MTSTCLKLPLQKFSCFHLQLGCTLIVSLAQQIGEIHNETAVKGLQRLCSFLPGEISPLNVFNTASAPTFLSVIHSLYIQPPPKS